MPGWHKGEIEIAVIEHAAGIAGIDLVHPLPCEIRGKLMHRQQRRPGVLADRYHVAGVVFVPVGERHMRHALGRAPERQAGILEGRISGEERVDEEARLAGIDSKAGMAEPGDLHDLPRVARL